MVAHEGAAYRQFGNVATVPRKLEMEMDFETYPSQPPSIIFCLHSLRTL